MDKTIESIKRPFDPNGRYPCSVCEINTNSESQLKIHKLGKKHKELSSGKKEGNAIDPHTRAEAIEAGIDVNEYLNDKSRDKKFDRFGFYCPYCKCFVTGQIQLLMHVEGFKHRQNTGGYKPNKEASNEKQEQIYTESAIQYQQYPMQAPQPEQIYASAMSAMSYQPAPVYATSPQPVQLYPMSYQSTPMYPMSPIEETPEQVQIYPMSAISYQSTPVYAMPLIEETPQPVQMSQQTYSPLYYVMDAYDYQTSPYYYTSEMQVFGTQFCAASNLYGQPKARV